MVSISPLLFQIVGREKKEPKSLQKNKYIDILLIRNI